MISEAASKRIGRPSVFSQREIDGIGPLFSGSKTKRGLQDAVYVFHATSALLQCRERGETWFGWFMDFGERRRSKAAILVQLGRIAVEYGVDTMLECARELPECTAKCGARVLRDRRTGKRRGGDVGDLLMHLAKSLDEYTDKHDTTLEMTLAAIAQLQEIVAHDVDRAPAYREDTTYG